jgi:hypothetical protein
MTFDETLRDTFDTLGDRLRAELRTAADQLTDALRVESTTAAAAPPVDAAPAHDALPDGVRAIGAARSLSEILDTLADCAAREAARAAVLVVRGGRFRGWRFAGFESGIAEPERIDIAEDEAGVLADAMRTGAPTFAPANGSRTAPAFAALPPERASAALPIAIGGQVVAVLYADEGQDTTNASGAFDLGRLDVLASYAARCLEAQTAFKAARALLDRLDDRGGAATLDPEDPPDSSGPAGGDAAARRYARLLVSEIKLYHEPAVLAGRRERDLAARLASEIARARLLYEERVPPPVRLRTDYFHAELVRTLAAGDASLMALHT